MRLALYFLPGLFLACSPSSGGQLRALEIAPIPTTNVARVEPLVRLLPDGRVVSCGGVNADARPSCETFDPATAQWTVSMLPSDQSARAVFTDGRVLVSDNEGNRYAFDPVSRAELRLDRGQGVPKSVFLGPDETFVCTDTCARFRASDSRWIAAASPHVAREIFTLTTLADGRVLAYGGNDHNHRPIGSAEIYDPNADAWTDVASSVPLVAHSALLLSDGRVFFLGGFDESGDFLGTAQTYEPATDTWTMLPVSPGPRLIPALAQLPDGSVLAAGGTAGSGVGHQAERFDLDRGKWTAYASDSLPPEARGVPFDGGLALYGQSGAVKITLR